MTCRMMSRSLCTRQRQHQSYIGCRGRGGGENVQLEPQLQEAEPEHPQSPAILICFFGVVGTKPKVRFMVSVEKSVFVSR